MPITKNIFLHSILFSSLLYRLFTLLYHMYLHHFVSRVAQVFTSWKVLSLESYNHDFFSIRINIIFHIFHTPEYFRNSSDYEFLCI